MPEVPAQIGSCEVQREIGRGGMGVVYLARDTELERDVAIKVLPTDLAEDESRRKRFERESKLLASLHHSNIAAVYGLEQVDDRPFLMMEYVPGQTLRERLDQGSIPVEESLRIAVQIARALEAAHQKGIVHRDLKPSNVKFTDDGTVKVLDFGLARDFDPMSLGTTEAEGERPTATGVVIGTPGYMSPEQMRSQAIDQRSDIWAFGCVLYEMLTGRTTFSSETATDAIGSALHEDPDWEALPGRVPATVRWLLRRCLAKDPDRRLHHIADARIELEEVLADPASASRDLGVAPVAVRAVAAPGLTYPLAFLAALATVLAVWGWARGPAVPSPTFGARPTHVEIAVPADQHLVDAAISPDGWTLAYTAKPARTEGSSHLYLRSLETGAVREVPRTRDASSLLFNPDGTWLGFFNGRSLQKVRVAGGNPEKICDENAFRIHGAAWIPDRGEGERIVYGLPADGLHEVSAEGGTPRRLTERRDGESTHWGPEYIGNGRILFSIRAGKDSYLHVLHLENGLTEPIDLGEADPLEVRYLPTGHLVYAQRDGLWAVRFDADNLEAKPPAIREVPDIGFNLFESPVFSVSASGTLAYFPGSGAIVSSQLIAVDRDGKVQRVLKQEEGAHYLWPNVSPDGKKLAYQTDDGDLWVLDIEGGEAVKLTRDEGGADFWPVWTQDSAFVTFGSNRDGLVDIFQAAADGSGDAQRILEHAGKSVGPISWSQDGTLAFVEVDNETGLDLLTWDGERERSFWEELSDDSMLTFSPDGRWMAYVSGGSGHHEIYVLRRHGSAPGVRVSTDGGTEPVWADTGTLFYRSGSRLLSVAMPDGQPPASPSRDDFGSEETVFEAGGAYPTGLLFPNYDVFPDGELFVFVNPEEETSPPVRIVLNWFTRLEQRLAWDR